MLCYSIIPYIFCLIKFSKMKNQLNMYYKNFFKYTLPAREKKFKFIFGKRKEYKCNLSRTKRDNNNIFKL